MSRSYRLVVDGDEVFSSEIQMRRIEAITYRFATRDVETGFDGRW